MNRVRAAAAGLFLLVAPSARAYFPQINPGSTCGFSSTDSVELTGGRVYNTSGTAPAVLQCPVMLERGARSFRSVTVWATDQHYVADVRCYLRNRPLVAGSGIGWAIRSSTKGTNPSPQVVAFPGRSLLTDGYLNLECEVPPLYDDSYRSSLSAYRLDY
jgi:hypothetical protein